VSGHVIAQLIAADVVLFLAWVAVIVLIALWESRK
jgi:hypothetical protein